MKKILNLIILSIIFIVSSCDLNKIPPGTIDTTEAIKSVEDASNMRNYLYIRLRGLYSGSFVYTGEITTDMFHASFNFGNRGGEEYRWEWTSSYGPAESLWSHAYYTVAIGNFLTEEIDKLIEGGKLSQEEIDQLTIYKGEAAFAKAASIFELAVRFANVYNASSASSDLGVMLVEKYNPTSDQKTYPPRSSQADTYVYILKNLRYAEETLASTKSSVGNKYLSKDAVTALYARIALYMGDYQTAIEKSTSLIGDATTGGRYPLIPVDDEEAFIDAWTNDSGDETIFQLHGEYPSSVPSSSIYGYVSLNANGIYAPDYILESGMVDLYANDYADDDVRFNNWIKTVKVTYGAVVGNVAILNKFPGNMQLQDPSLKTSNYVHQIKPFRIAEQYLIAAEAYAMMGNNDVEACKYYNALRAKRIVNYTEETLFGDALVKAIRDERLRELIGEGFRMWDLKRYGEGFTRTPAQDTEVISNAGGDKTENLTVAPSDFRFNWPIPKTEIDSNPQIKEQQNPGY